MQKNIVCQLKLAEEEHCETSSREQLIIPKYTPVKEKAEEELEEETEQLSKILGDDLEQKHDFEDSCEIDFLQLPFKERKPEVKAERGEGVNPKIESKDVLPKALFGGFPSSIIVRFFSRIFEFSPSSHRSSLGLMPPGPDCRLQATSVVWEYQKDFKDHQNEPEKNKPCGRRDKTSSNVLSPEDVVLLITQTEESQAVPAEKCKTLLAFFFAWSALLLNIICLSFIHDRVPDRTRVGPLPDILFDVLPPQDWALDVSEIIIITSIIAVLILLLLHRHRFIVMRRVFLMMGILYLMRCITMFVTQLPIASDTYYCSPQENVTTPLLVMKRVLQLSSGFGLSINGKHTFCGDYIYSGHTITLTMAYLVIREYTPEEFHPIHWLSWMASASGVAMIIVSRGHYTIDVILAYYVTTRVFWIYHCLISDPNLKCQRRANALSRVWWFSLFVYMEANVPVHLSSGYEWPFPWPKRKHPRVC